MDATDPLLPQPWGDITIPPGLSGTAVEEWLATQVSDHFNLNALVWQARDAEGRLAPPPAEHVLDHLARSNDLVEEERSNTTIGANTVTVQSDLPECDLCGDPARYDARLASGGHTVNAFACPSCYTEHGSGTLGASGDVYIMLDSEVPSDVRRICNEIREGQDKPPLFLGHRA